MVETAHLPSSSRLPAVGVLQLPLRRPPERALVLDVGVPIVPDALRVQPVWVLCPTLAPMPWSGRTRRLGRRSPNFVASLTDALLGTAATWRPPPSGLHAAAAACHRDLGASACTGIAVTRYFGRLEPDGLTTLMQMATDGQLQFQPPGSSTSPMPRQRI